jgi:replicative superfamily II helicase
MQCSKADYFWDQLADLLNAERENADVFSVQLHRKHPPVTNIRFAARGSLYFNQFNLVSLFNAQGRSK